ncbi:DUF4128 domain-containing protein [Myxococcus xanthus]|uniref:phage tail terminator-like protein n=1 Tax=Myxococcus xanthus TaxID=34 RepID=UPI001916EE05|nr:phage tail terminator-like protein [Myxococcus xanthus]QQR47744.1 DUF4128 domain-containing protein [Myxococcus xanthus]
MSPPLLDIPQALELRAREVLAPLLGESNLAYPNVVFTPTAGVPWARLDCLPARTSPAGAGVDSHTRRPGVFQVLLFHPVGEGTAASLTVAQALCDAFKRGTRLGRNDTVVSIHSASVGPALRDEPWWATPVSISWLVHSLD